MDLGNLLLLSTIVITLFLAMGLSYLTSASSDYISAIIFSGIIIWAVIWVIGLIIWFVIMFFTSTSPDVIAF